MNIENNNHMVENGSANDICEKIKPILSLAITTVPMQEANWDGVYSMEEALANGTLYPELNMPFEGSGR